MKHYLVSNWLLASLFASFAFGCGAKGLDLGEDGAAASTANDELSPEALAMENANTSDNMAESGMTQGMPDQDDGEAMTGATMDPDPSTLDGEGDTGAQMEAAMLPESASEDSPEEAPSMMQPAPDPDAAGMPEEAPSMMQPASDPDAAGTPEEAPSMMQPASEPDEAGMAAAGMAMAADPTVDSLKPLATTQAKPNDPFGACLVSEDAPDDQFSFTCSATGASCAGWDAVDASDEQRDTFEVVCSHSCMTDAQCPVPATGDATPVCVALSSSCQLPCDDTTTCPDGYTCISTEAANQMTEEGSAPLPRQCMQVFAPAQ